MTSRKIWLLMVLFTAFGFSEMSAQITAPSTSNTTTVKPKRTYERKLKAVRTSPTAVAPQTLPAEPQPTKKAKRTYKRKTTTVTVPPAKTTSPATTYKRPTTAKAPKTVYMPKSGGTVNNHQIMVGPKGGKYYINKNGNKTYIK